MRHVIKIFGIPFPLIARKIREDDGKRANTLTKALICVNKHNSNRFWKLFGKREIKGYKSPWED